MNKIKCPVCNIALEPVGDLLQCPNDHCGWVGNAELWQELVTKCNQLEIARKALEDIKAVCDNCRWCDSNLYDPTPGDGRRIAEITNKALEQIEHKE